MTVKEELLDMVALKEATRGIDIKDALNKVLTKAQIPPKKLVSVVIDGAPAMVGKRLGIIALIKNDSIFANFFPIHCIIHRKYLVTKHLNYENVIKTVLDIVHYIRLNEKTNR